MFLSRELPEVVSFRKAQAGQNAKKELQAMVRECIEEEKPVKEIVQEVKEAMAKSSGIQEQDAVVMVNFLFILVTKKVCFRDEFLCWRSALIVGL